MNSVVQNTSGLKEMSKYKCLVLPDAVEEVSAGGIILAHETVDKEKYNSSKGTVVVLGGNVAYDWEGWKPQVGDRISFYHQGSRFFKGKDGKDYRIIQDEDIIGLLDE